MNDVKLLEELDELINPKNIIVATENPAQEKTTKKTNKNR